MLTLIQRLLAPAQLRVGELWVSDAWSVAQEHAATAISESVLTSLAVERERQARPAADAPTLIVSCVEQEWHALPALMVTEHLRAEGFGVSYLGANSSAQGLVRHVHELGPRAVLLSCSLSAFLPLVAPAGRGGPRDRHARRGRRVGVRRRAASGPRSSAPPAFATSARRGRSTWCGGCRPPYPRRRR